MEENKVIKKEPKVKSRKFMITVAQIALTIAVPLVYKRFEVGESVMMLVLAAINGAGAIYSGANVLSKKYLSVKNG